MNELKENFIKNDIIEKIDNMYYQYQFIKHNERIAKVYKNFRDYIITIKDNYNSDVLSGLYYKNITRILISGNYMTIEEFLQ